MLLHLVLGVQCLKVYLLLCINKSHQPQIVASHYIQCCQLLDMRKTAKSLELPCFMYETAYCFIR